MLDINSDFIYKLLLQEGSINFESLLLKSGFKKNILEKIIDDLLKNEFIFIDGKLYKPVYPKDYLRNLLDLKKEIDSKISNFEADLTNYEIYLDDQDKFPHVKVYRGLDSIARVYEESLKSDFWRGIVYIDEVFIQFEEYLQKIFKEFSKKGKDAKDIFIDSKIARKVKNDFQCENYKIRLLPVDKVVKSDLVVLKDKVFFLSYVQDEMLVVEMKSKTIVDLHLMMFDNLWSNLDENEA